MVHAGADDVAEAVHLASRIAAYGYLFPIAAMDHAMAVRNDSHTYYRFQTPCLYPSRCSQHETDTTVDYAVYLCKRTMQNKHRLELADFEAERLASLQSLYYHKWEFIYMQVCLHLLFIILHILNRIVRLCKGILIALSSE